MIPRKMIVLFMSCVLVLAVSATALAADELYGTWRLVSFKRTLVNTGETTDMFGTSPKGILIFGRDGRVFILLTSDRRPNVPADKMTDQDRAELFKTMVAFAGSYTFDGKTLKLRPDISWNENWNGTEQIRNARLEGKKLIYSAEPSIGAIDGKLRTSVYTWEKVR